MQGRIVKGVGGFYEIEAGSARHTCRARGKFRREGLTPLPGDLVEFTQGSGEEHGSVDRILPRRNALKRPAVANLDLLVLVTSAGDPEPDLKLLDKLLLSARSLGVEIVLVVNKCDLVPAGAVEAIARQYEGAASSVLAVSAATGVGRDGLLAALAGRCSCLAGQSGVGKSSILNCLFPGRALPTGDLSEKTARGKHTTRHAELLPMPCGGYVADTPGFSLAEVDRMDPAGLPALYPEFAPFEGMCRFAGCLHDAEPGCAVKDAVREGEIPAGRWERYREILKQTKEAWRNRYD